MFWPKYLHRKTFLAVLVADSVLLPLMYCLPATPHGLWKMLLGFAVLALNLPSLPLALVFRIFIPDDVHSILLEIALNAIIVLFTSYVWGIYAARRLNKKHRDFKLTRD